MIYFFTRLAHYVIYVLGVTLIRTVAFAIGVCVQASLALTILATTIEAGLKCLAWWTIGETRVN